MSGQHAPMPTVTPAPNRSAITATTIFGLDGMASLRTDWLRLEAASVSLAFFQSYDWCHYIARRRAEITGATAPEPRTVVVRNATSIVAIWPLALTSGIAGRYAGDLTEPYGQYSDILIAPDADVPAIRQAVIDELRGWRIDGLILRRVRQGSNVAAILEDHATAVGPIEHAPAAIVGTNGDAGDWHRGLTTKTRKNLRNLRNRLAREGSLTHRIADTPAERAIAISACFRGRTDWLQASGLSSAAFADPAFEAIVCGLANGGTAMPNVLAARLDLATPQGSQILSLHWGFEHQGRYYAYMAWKNPVFDAFSPGRLHLETIVPALAQRGNAVVDLLVPALPYKTSMSNDLVAVSARAVAFTARGRLMISTWHAHMRPALKNAASRLSPDTRRRIMDVIRTARLSVHRAVARITAGRPSIGPAKSAPIA